MQQFLGVDFGTSGIRAVVIDAQCRILTSRRVSLPAPLRQAQSVTQDPDLWWAGLCHLLESLASGNSLAQLRAISVDGTSGTVLATDSHGAAVAPAIMYNDSGSADEAAQIARLAPDTTGALGAGSSLAKLLYLRRQLAPEGFARILHQADWILGKLSGYPGITDENHALKLGYDAVNRNWPAWLDALDIPHRQLPDVVPPGTVVGKLQPSLAQRWRLPADVAIVAGTTDSTAGVIAAGVTDTGDAVTSLGSTLVIKVLSEQPVFSPVHGVYSHRLGDRWLAGGASNSGGAVLRQFFDDAMIAALSKTLDVRRPGCLEYYPLPAAGERFPVHDPALQPRMSPRPRDDSRFLQGLLQGIARIEQRGYRLLESLSAPYPGRVFTVGGGAANPAWTAIRHKFLKRDILVPPNPEAAYGAALLARQGYLHGPEQVPATTGSSE